MGDSADYHNLGPPRSSINEQANHDYYNLGMLYCGFFVVATVGLILAIYHCLALNWCTNYPSSNAETTRTSSSSSKVKAKAMEELESSVYKYSKQANKGGQEEDECVVCLSLFEEGEDVRKLFRCNHSFHLPCIDMWLYSHFHCPLCRAPVGGCRGGAAAFSDFSVLPV